MPAHAVIEGVACRIERLPNGNIAVTHSGGQSNAMHGPGTDGNFYYEVHPCQRNQFDILNLQLPPDERATEPFQPEQRPWWSLAAGERANLKE